MAARGRKNFHRLYGTFAGDAPVCDPEAYYKCASPTLDRYVRDNEVGNCNCPRQCRRLSYRYRISQAKMSDLIIKFAKEVFHIEASIDAIRRDVCSLEVSDCISQFQSFLVATYTLF